MSVYTVMSVEDKDAGGGGDEADAEAGDGAAEFFHLPSSSPLSLQDI